MGNPNTHLAPAKNPSNVQIVVKSTVQDQLNVKFGKEKKGIMRIKTIRKISYFEAKQNNMRSFEPRYSKIVQSAIAKPQTRTCGTQYDPLDFKQDTKSSSKSTSSSVLKPQT